MLRFRPVKISTIGAISSVGFAISATLRNIAGTAFTAKPLSDNGTFEGFIGLPAPQAAPKAIWDTGWNIQTRTWERPQITFHGAPSPGPPKSTITSARGINDSGDVVGWWKNASSQSHMFQWPSGSRFPNLNANPLIDVPNVVFPTDGQLHNGALAINNAGTVVGQYCENFLAFGIKVPPSIYTHFGFVGPLLSNLVIVRVEKFGAAAVVVRGINGYGHIVGRYDIWRDNSSLRTLGFVSTDVEGDYDDCRNIPFDGAYAVVVAGINDDGWIVGSVQEVKDGPFRGFLWQINSQGETVGAPMFCDYSIHDPTYTSTQLNCIDNGRVMIGTAGRIDPTTNKSTSLIAFICWDGP